MIHKRNTAQSDREKADTKPQVNPRDNPPGLQNAGGALGTSTGR
nr:MAG TPA: hypothetical protein [Caudoviricetes sp.]